MRLKVEHHSRYRFTEPQARVVQLLRLFPSDTTHQTVVQWRIDVDCDARLRSGQDGLGNETRMLYAEGPLDAIEITVSGEVLLTDGDGVVEGTSEPFPPLLFRRATSLTAADDAIVALAEAADGEGEARLWALNSAIHDRLRRIRDRPGEIPSATETLASGEGTSRDLAQLFVAAARAIDVPARYVSGYSLEGDAERSALAPHGWAEAHVEGRGWIAFDPSTGGSPGLDHVRVAIGLDAAGASPIAGTRIGHGDEALDVDVRLEELGGE